MSKKVDKLVQKSGFSRKQLGLLKAFIKEPWGQFTTAQIKEISKNKSQNYVFGALKKFVRARILKEERQGNVNVYSADSESESCIAYFAFAEYLIKDMRSDIPLKSIKQVTDGIKSPFYALLIGGSYAEGTQKQSSDIDIAIIIPDCEKKKSFEAVLTRGELIMPEVHGFIFTREEFYLMLVNKEYNYGKEIAKKHIIVYGAEAYYKILFEAMRYGFKG